MLLFLRIDILDSIPVLHDITFVDSMTGWICGDSSIILHTDNGGIVGIDQSVQCPGVQVQVYPNPLSDNVNVEFEVTKPSRASIQILNAVGNIVWENDFGNQSSGKHTIHLDIHHLAFGLYMIRLQTGEQSVVKRIV
ncbi:MAG: T9SS type A sorting domain-containing protein, partial [Bacteroidales bacterium]|nr:T9SS type A sorting domain-containing protein [Bacteroidales bacterium]